MGLTCCKSSVQENERKISSQVSEFFLLKGYKSIPNRFISGFKYKPKAMPGLENMGNTSYLNSVLQSLSHCQPLKEYFLSSVFEEELNLTAEPELLIAFAELVCTQWFCDYKCIVPQRLVYLVGQKAPQFAQGKQQDAYELLCFLLNFFHNNLRRQCTQDNSDINMIQEEEEKEAAKAWKLHLVDNSSVIVDLFSGQLKSSFLCSKCDVSSTVFENFDTLSLGIPAMDRDARLEDCLYDFTVTESIEMWKCPHCLKHGEASKKTSLWKVPNVLVVHLNRFANPHGKINDRVRFPTCGLDLKNYVAGPQKNAPVYDLFARIDHIGEADNGHFTAYAKNQGKWLYFDDTEVSPFSLEETSSKNAYILFYFKCSVEEFCRQSISLPHLWPHVNEIQKKFNSNLSSSFVEAVRSVDESALILPPPSIHFYS